MAAAPPGTRRAASCTDGRAHPGLLEGGRTSTGVDTPTADGVCQVSGGVENSLEQAGEPGSGESFTCLADTACPTPGRRRPAARTASTAAAVA